MTTDASVKTVSFSPDIDWITLASYNFTAYTDSVAALRREYPGQWKHAKWLQYQGWRRDTIFVGKAIQTNDKEHYIIKVSGSDAGRVAEFLRHKELAPFFYCTRIDLQRTIDPPGWWNVRELHDSLSAEGHKVSMIQSDSGNTLYIGARTSPRFTRFYEKELGHTMLRCEIELKSQYARLAWQLYLEMATIADIYGQNLKALPLPDDIKSDYMPDEASDIDWRYSEEIVTMQKRLKWLETLIPTFNRMANDHDIGPVVRDLFYALSLDPIDTTANNGIE